MSNTNSETTIKKDPLGQSYDPVIVDRLSSLIADLDSDRSKKMQQNCLEESQKYSRIKLLSQTDKIIAELWQEEDPQIVEKPNTDQKAEVESDLSSQSDKSTVQSPYSKKKIAIFHHFFKRDCKGGGENWILEMADHYQADIWVGGVDLEAWGPEMVEKDPGFAGRVWESGRKFVYLHTESKKPLWKHIKRQLYFLFSPKVRELKKYDLIIFSYGNIAFVPDRLAGKIPW